jgi:tRNA dimethylallyltransferase
MPQPPVPPLRILAGPTAVGKTALAIELARRHGAVILSADSMQVYRGMEIGTAQPDAAQCAAVPHFLVGHVEPGEEYHVARFVEEATAVLAREEAAGRPVLVCGGTGLFLKHLVQGIFAGAPRDPGVRARLVRELEVGGLDVLRARLRAVDPAREAEINPNDAMRVVRALEVFETTGVPMSEHHARDSRERQVRPARYVVLDRPRPMLVERIHRRVAEALEAGWLEEARRLMDRGLPDDAQACKALGYRELFHVLRGAWTLDRAADEIKARTRQFARRQRTWFRAVPDALWVDLDESGDAVARIDALLFPDA